MLSGMAMVLAGFGTAHAVSSEANVPEVQVQVGMTCVVPDGWWSLDPQRPVQAEPVKVVALKPLYTGAPGAWIEPTRGKLAGQQYQVALQRLTECR